MNRREFLLTSGTVALAAAAPATISATVLYGDRSVSLDKARLEAENLWVRAARRICRASTSSR